MLVSLLGFDKPRAKVVYGYIDEALAPLVASRFMVLRSVWVKMGQYLSARADVTPARWAAALKILQDDMPSDAHADVRKTIQEAFQGIVLEENKEQVKKRYDKTYL